MNAALDVAAAVCLLAGALLSLAAGVALVRFPDLLSRMHAATKPQVLGLLLVLLGCGLRLRDTVDITTLLLVAVFQLGTAPVAAHMVGRAGYRARQVRHDLLLLDELADQPGPAAERGREAAVRSAQWPQ
ncbi:monovalent cation/H(+) antiporter subunit G [Actinoplanes sp. NPDC051494]|uniref:monovalent cation/H(+) antiporter subunit G n=1 Tax=Actinoplanes sp. NPDC051494 TaxID=3363907 RepID=UPI0037B3F7E3